MARRTARLFLCAAAFAVGGGVAQAQTIATAPPPAPTLAELQQRIDALQSQLDALKQAMARQGPTGPASASVQATTSQMAQVASASVAAPEHVVTPPTAPARATLANGRPGWASADGAFTAQLNAVLHFDAGNYYQAKNLPAQITGAARDLNGGTTARRARIGFGGVIYSDFEYNFLYDFGGSGQEDTGRIDELWFQYNGGLKPFHLRGGYFEPIVGLEASTSTNSLLLMERASPAEVARNVAAGGSRASLQLFGADDFKGELAPGVKVHWQLSGAVTGNTGASLNSGGGFAVQPFDEQIGVLGHVGIAPYKGKEWVFHVGANAQYVIKPNDATGSGSPIAGRYVVQLRDRPELRLDTTRLVDTGLLNAAHLAVYGAEAGLQFRNLYLQTEYFRFVVDGNGATAATSSPDFTGWYLQGSWVLTGEHRRYNAEAGAFNAPLVAHPFSPSAGTWGAFELGARYSDLDLNYQPGAAGTATPLGAVRGGDQQVWGVSLTWYVNPVVRFILQGQHVDIERLNPAGLRLDQAYDTLALRSQFAW